MPGQRGAPALSHMFQAKPWIEVAAVMFTAASKTSDDALDAADSRKVLTTIRTAINEPCRISSRGERQTMTALLVGDSQIYAGLLPFGPVRRDPPTACAKLRENVRQFMSHSSVDFCRILD